MTMPAGCSHLTRSTLLVVTAHHCRSCHGSDNFNEIVNVVWCNRSRQGAVFLSLLLVASFDTLNAAADVGDDVTNHVGIMTEPVGNNWRHHFWRDGRRRVPLVVGATGGS